jgi:uncharacterized membrane protein YqjE
MEPPREAGLAASLKRVGAHALSLLQVRLELLATEIEEERSRLSRLLVTGVCAFFLLGFGLLALALLLTVAWWETHRLLPLSLLVGFFLGAGILCALSCARLVWRGSRLFGASLAELAKDRAALER